MEIKSNGVLPVGQMMYMYSTGHVHICREYFVGRSKYIIIGVNVRSNDTPVLFLFGLENENTIQGGHSSFRD